MIVTEIATDDWLLGPQLAPHIEHDPLRPLYDAAERGELAMPFCASCALPLELEQVVCDGCAAFELRWRTVEPLGTVHSSTMVHRREPALVLADAPYPVIDVELASGHRIVLTTISPRPSAPSIGTPVRIGFRRLGGVSIPAVHSWEDHQ